jgi:hypothetical protein
VQITYSFWRFRIVLDVAVEPRNGPYAFHRLRQCHRLRRRIFERLRKQLKQNDGVGDLNYEP